MPRRKNRNMALVRSSKSFITIQRSPLQHEISRVPLLFRQAAKRTVAPSAAYKSFLDNARRAVYERCDLINLLPLDTLAFRTLSGPQGVFKRKESQLR